MRFILCVIAMCYNHVGQAIPSGYYQNHNLQLVGIPDLSHFSNLAYPHMDIQDLGTEIKGPLPQKEIKIIRTIKITVPKPYPVKVPVKVPYPVHVDKPYPVQVTKLVHVPQPVPVEVIKSIPVPIEVPKPYPVPSNEYNYQVSGEEKSYEQNYQPASDEYENSRQAYDNNYHQSEHYNSNAGINSQYDQNGGYSAVVHTQNHERQENQGADNENYDNQKSNEEN